MSKRDFKRSSIIWFTFLGFAILFIIGGEVDMYLTPRHSVTDWIVVALCLFLLLVNREVYETLIKLHWHLYKWRRAMRGMYNNLKIIQKHNELLNKICNPDNAIDKALLDRGLEMENEVTQTYLKNKQFTFFQD